ncbi:MAG: transposase [Rhodobacterales bacterium]|nr:transposase [Rhodobacterales bacterium]
MTHSLRTAVVELLSTDIAEPWVRECAKAHNVVRRVGKVAPYALVMVVLLGLGVRGPPILAPLGQTYCRVSGVSLARSAFWARMSPSLAAPDEACELVKAHLTADAHADCKAFGPYGPIETDTESLPIIKHGRIREDPFNDNPQQEVQILGGPAQSKSCSRSQAGGPEASRCLHRPSSAARGYARAKNWKVKNNLRVIAVRHAQTGEYERYATNAPPDKLTVKHVRATYRLRWEVETFFKLSKPGCGMSELPSCQESNV